MKLLDTFKNKTVMGVTVQRSAEEKAFVRRLDLFLLTFGCISQVIKYLGMYSSRHACPRIVLSFLQTNRISTMHMFRECRRTSISRATS